MPKWSNDAILFYMAMEGPIVVIGSINMDLACRIAQRPKAGETTLGESFVTIPGGKGANQATAVAKLGGKVHMVGRVGDDDFGERLVVGLERHGVDTEHVVVTEGVSSGVAMILVDKKGENSIVVAPGANALVSPADVDAARDVIASAAVVLMQLEIPVETIRHAIALCQELGVYTILDPAPATARLPRAVFGVDMFTPNQTEVEILLDRGQTVHVSKKRIYDPKQSASDLLSRGARSVVLKLGSKGALYADHEGSIMAAKAFKVKIVDTTAAGDCFSAGLAIGRAEGMSLPDTLRFANAAGAICCQGFGAQPSLPNRDAVELLMRSA